MNTPGRPAAPFVISAGTNYAVAIHSMVMEAAPGARFTMRPTPLTTPELRYHDPFDPWTEAEMLAMAVGCRLRRRGDRVTGYVPLREQVRFQWWLRVGLPLRRARRRVKDRIDPPIEYPDPDYSD